MDLIASFMSTPYCLSYRRPYSPSMRVVRWAFLCCDKCISMPFDLWLVYNVLSTLRSGCEIATEGDLLSFTPIFAKRDLEYVVVAVWQWSIIGPLSVEDVGLLICL